MLGFPAWLGDRRSQRVTRILLLALSGVFAMSCGGSVDVSKGSGPGLGAPDASTLVHDGSATGPNRSTNGREASSPTADAWIPPAQHVVDGMACAPVHPETASGSCPVMPRGGALCAPLPGPDPCGGHGWCEYPMGPGIPERLCPQVVCTDDRGNCPPAESVCTPFQGCTAASDCKGEVPSHECVACPLLPDGTQTISCSHWSCTDGKCVVGGPCDERPTTLACSGGSGCPRYYFSEFDTTCTSDTDCDVFDHFESCCSTRAIGVSIRDKTRMAGIQAQCDALLEPFARICGCQPSHPAEDGSSPLPGQQIVGACIAGSCKAVVRGRIQ